LIISKYKNKIGENNMTREQIKKKRKRWSLLLIIIFLCLSSLNYLFINSNLYTVDAASTWTQTSDKDFDNGTTNNLTMVGIGKDAELEIDFSDLYHWQKQTPLISPNAGYNFAMTTISTDDKVVLFGNLDDTWEYDLSINNWVDKTPNPRPPNYPVVRSYHAMASVWGDDKAILFGGQYGLSSIADTWEYDSSTGSWTDKTKTFRPDGRSRPGIASIYGDDKVLMFGGYNSSFTPYYLNDTLVYDSSDGSWTDKTPSPITTNYPSGRFSHGMASIYGTDKVLLFGGMTNWWNFLGDTWLYDYSDDNWTKITPVGSSPRATANHRMVPLQNDDKVLLFGGQSSSNNYLNDTWVYDLSDSLWTKIIPRDPFKQPSARHGFGFAAIDGEDKIILFGGRTTSGFGTDTWTYNHILPMKNGTYVSGSYDTGSKSDFKTLSWYADTPINTRIELQIRTAANQTELETKLFVGPDGTDSSFYSSSPSDIWAGHDNERWIQYIVYFNITAIDEPPSLKEVSIDYNCLPNTIILSPIDGSLLSINKPTFKWTFEDFDSTKQKAFQVIIDNDINFSSVDFNSTEQITGEEQWEFPSGTSYSEIQDGFWYWKVRTKDEDEVWTEYSDPQKICIDTKAPSSVTNFPVNNGFYNSISSMYGVANEGATGSGIVKIEIAINRHSDNSYWDGTNWVSFDKWLIANGTVEWFYDTSNIEWTTGSKYSVQSHAVDSASNIEVSTIKNVFTIDKDNPISNIEKPMNGVWINKLNVISGTSNDFKGAGVNKVEVCIRCSKDFNEFDGGSKEEEYWSGTSWTPRKIWLKCEGTTQWLYNTSNIPLTTGDYYTMISRATDEIDNTEIPGMDTTFMYDENPPMKLAIFINNDEEYSVTPSVLLSLQAEDIGSGLSEMSFSMDSAVWSAWEAFNFTRSFELPAGDGKKTIYFKARDITGNIAESVFDTIVLDTIPPEELSIVIEDYSKHTNSKRVKINLQGTDKLSGIGDVSFCYNGLDWLSWEPFTQMRYLTFPNDITDGENKIYFKAKDNAGNIADPVFDTIILDTLPPFSLSILINDGSDETNSTSVTIVLQAFDNTSGVNRISFSDDGVSWSDWEIFKELRSYDLSPGNGEKTIYFRVSDEAGNIGGPISDKIILNITTPQKDFQAKETPSSGYDFWMIMFIMAIVLFIIIIVGFIIINKRNKPADQDLLQPGALTIRPGGLSGPQISMAQIPKTIDQPQLPSAIKPMGSQGIRANSGIAPTPMLVKSTQVSQVNIPQPTLKLPVLPPAKVQEKESEVSPTTQTPVPTVVTPSSTPTITTIPTTSPGPIVHLPESKPQPTLENSTQPKPQTKTTNQIT
jgi:hypothetical protein